MRRVRDHQPMAWKPPLFLADLPCKLPVFRLERRCCMAINASSPSPSSESPLLRRSPKSRCAGVLSTSTSLSLPASLANNEPAMSTSFSDMAGEAARLFIVACRGCARRWLVAQCEDGGGTDEPSLSDAKQGRKFLSRDAAAPNFSGAAMPYRLSLWLVEHLWG